MHIVYYCRHCKVFLGTIDANRVSYDDLGFSSLTSQEMADIIEYHAGDHTLYVKTICEHCETALMQNPELFLSETPIQ